MRWVVAIVLAAAAAAACGGTSDGSGQAPSASGGDGSGGDPGSSGGASGGTSGTSGGTSGASGGTSGTSGGTSGASGGPSATDGTPTRVACTSSFGSDITTTHGRLDGYLVSIVPLSTHGCNNDTSHLHLQVKANGQVYDVAVNLDTLEADLDAPLPGTAWAEGWHANEQLDYPSTLSLHASAFAQTSPTTQRTNLQNALANANHIAIFGTGYGPTGAHDIHRKGFGDDGAIVINPLDAKAHIITFRFSTDSF